MMPCFIILLRMLAAAEVRRFPPIVVVDAMGCSIAPSTEMKFVFLLRNRRIPPFFAAF
jgi:hypothetical protein